MARSEYQRIGFFPGHESTQYGRLRPADHETTPNDDLIDASHRGDLSGIRNAIKRGADVYNSNTLSIASNAGNSSIVNYLLNNYNFSEEQMHNALDEGCRKGKLNIIKIFLDRGLSLSAHEMGSIIFSKNHQEILHYLIDNKIVSPNNLLKANVAWDFADRDGSIIKYLISEGGDIRLVRLEYLHKLIDLGFWNPKNKDPIDIRDRQTYIRLLVDLLTQIKACSSINQDLIYIILSY